MESKGLLLVGLHLYAYWPTLHDMSDKWIHDPQYSHGLLVPFFCLYLLSRNTMPDQAEAKPAPLLGFGLLLLAGLLRIPAGLLYFVPLDGFSLLGSLTGTILILGGWPLLRWCWQALVFGLFLIPLPYQLERLMGSELQMIATLASTFTLQICGQPAISEGNTIRIQEIQLGVVEACSGLRMMMTFLAFATGIVFLIQRCWVVKLLLLSSAIPIALLTNILRITATGLAHVWLRGSPSHDTIMDFVHDFNGWMMMPVGLGLLLLELWLFRHLLIDPPQRQRRQEGLR